jgi:hypothetical protein
VPALTLSAADSSAHQVACHLYGAGRSAPVSLDLEVAAGDA